jgi:hypothetical protein
MCLLSTHVVKKLDIFSEFWKYKSKENISYKPSIISIIIVKLKKKF